MRNCIGNIWYQVKVKLGLFIQGLIQTTSASRADGQIILIVFPFLFILISMPALAQKVWQPTATRVWSDPANWSGNTLPTAADDVVFDGTNILDCVIDVNVTVKSITMTSAYMGNVSQQPSVTITLARSNGNYPIDEGKFTVSGGTFYGGDASITAKMLILSGGTFYSTSGSMFIGGNYTGNYWSIFPIDITGGTFNNSNGTVVVDLQTAPGNLTYELNVLPSTYFHHFILSPTIGLTAVFQPNAGNAIRANGDLTLNNGYTHLNWEVKGNLVAGVNYDGIRNGNPFTLTFNGTDDQTISAGAIRLGKLVVNKPSGTVSMLSGITNLSITGLDLQQGEFIAPSNNLSVGGDYTGVYTSPQTVFNQSATGIFTHNNASLTIDPVNVNSAYSFVLDVIATTQFYNLTYNPTGTGARKMEPGTGDEVNIMNTFTITDGLIRGQHNVWGNLIASSTFDGVEAIDNSTSPNIGLSFNGASNQTYSFATGAGRLGHLKIDKPSGSVSAAAGTTSLNVYYLSILRGSFTAPSGTLNVGGSFANIYTSVNTFNQASGTTFNHSNGTVSFNPTAAGNSTTGFNIDVEATTQFYNIIFNGTNNFPFISPAGDKIVCQNALTLTNGRTNTAILEVSGNVTVASTFDSGNSPLSFVGTTDQSFNLTGGIALFDGDITINKPSGDVVLASTLQLNAATQDVTFVQGNIISSSTNKFVIGDNVLVSGASNLSFVEGPVVKIGNDAFTFPVGKGLYYAPLTISAPSVASDAFTAEYFLSDPQIAFGVAMSAPIEHFSSKEYWSLARTLGTSTPTVQLSWDTRSGGVDDLLDLRVAEWDGSQWIDVGNASRTGTMGSGTITSSTPSFYNSFTLGSINSNNPLPIKLIEFKAKLLNDKSVQLDWSTASELNNDYFIVQYSVDAVSYHDLAQIDGNGTSNEKISYQYIDKTPTSRNNYYRLKQIDFDGNSEAFNVVLISLNDYDALDFQILPFPNPSVDIVNFNIPNSFSGEILTLKVINSEGRIFIESDINVESSLLSIDTVNFPSGLYHVFLYKSGQILARSKFVNSSNQ